MGVKLSGFVHDINGNAQNNLTVELFERTDSATAVTSTSTNSSGKWAFDYSTEGRYDVRISIGGGQYFWVKYDDIIQAEQAEIGSLLIRGSDNAYTTTFTSTPTAARTVTVPDATLTLAGSNLAQTFSANQTFTGTVTVGSDGSGTDVIFYSGNAGDNFTWDASEEKLTITGTATTTALDIADGNVVVADDLTVSGNTTLNGNVTLGNAASDVITVTGTVAGANAMIFEGGTADAHETILTPTDPTADATIKLPAMSAGTYFLPVLDTASTVAISAIPAEINYLDLGATAVGNAIASKAVVLDSNLDYTGIRNLTITGTLSDGNYTFDTSGNVSGLGTVTTSGVLDITDATDSSDATGDTGALRTEGGASIAKKLYVGTDLSVGGNLTVSGTTTTVDTTNTVAKDSLIELNNGASSNSNDLGIVIERGSTGDNSIIAWDESADGFTVGTTTATGASTGNLTITAAPFTAAAIVGTTIDASTDFTIGNTVITDGVVTDSTGLQLAANLDIDGTADISGGLTLSAGGDGALNFANAGENSIKIPDNQASALIIEEANNAYITFVTTNSSEAITVAKATTFSVAATLATGTTIGNLTLADGSITDSGGALDFGNETLTTTGVITAGGLTIPDAGNIGSASDTDAIAISSAGVTTFSAAVDIQGGYANGGGAPYDGVVDAGGGGNWTTLQAGDDALDGGAYSMLVKAGTYSSQNLVVATNNAYIFIEPGTVIDGTITLSGTGIYIQCGNGVDLEGLIISGNSNTFDGGGWETIIDGGAARHAVDITTSFNKVQNTSVKTTDGASNDDYDGVRVHQQTNQIVNVQCINSGRYAFHSDTDGYDAAYIGCVASDSDDHSFYIASTRNRIVGCHAIGAGTDGYHFAATGDHGVMTGSVSRNPGAQSVEVVSGCTDVVITGNRLDGAITDGGTNTIASGNSTVSF